MSNIQKFMYTVFSLFCGWGGGDCGLHKAGFFTRWAVDSDKHARTCFKLNFPNALIGEWNLLKNRIEFVMHSLGIDKGVVDLLLLACPCQGISKAGKGDPYHDQNILFIRSLRHYIPAILPRVWVLENVDGLILPPMTLFNNLMQEEFKGLSDQYIIKHKIMNTLHYGVPQDRKRIIIIGVHRSLGIEPSFPEPDLTDTGKRIMDVMPELDGIRYGFGAKKFKHRTGFCNTITKTPNLWAVRDGVKRDFTPAELLKFCAYPADWKYTGSDNQVWNRIGNSIMPPFMQAIGEHIRTHILEKAGIKPTDITPYLTGSNHP